MPNTNPSRIWAINMICKNNNSVFKEKLQYFVNRTTENISSQDDKNKGLTATDSNIGMPIATMTRVGKCIHFFTVRLRSRTNDFTWKLSSINRFFAWREGWAAHLLRVVVDSVLFGQGNWEGNRRRNWPKQLRKRQAKHITAMRSSNNTKMKRAKNR